MLSLHLHRGASRTGVWFSFLGDSPFHGAGSVFRNFLVNDVLLLPCRSVALCARLWKWTLSGRSFVLMTTCDVSLVIHPSVHFPSLSVPFYTPFSSLLFISTSSTICLLTQHPFSSNSEPTMLANFSRTVRNYVPSSILIPTATPAPPHVSHPGSVVGSFMLSTLLSVLPPLPPHSSSYGGGNKCRGRSGIGSAVGGNNDWRTKRGAGTGAGGQFGYGYRCEYKCGLR